MVGAVGPDRVLVESLPPGGSSMNGMNLSGKPGIVQPMQMPPTFGQPPMPLIQPRLGTLHFTTGPQQPSLTMHFGRAVLGGEVALLVVAGPVAALVHGLAEQPGGPQRVVQRDHRRLAGGHVEQVGHGLGQVVRLDRAAGHADDRDAGLGLPVPAEVVGHAHGAGRVAGHGVDAAVGGAGAGGDDGGGLGRQPVQPLAGGHRLAGRRVVAEPAPVALVVQLLVGDGALDHQHERLQLAAVGLEEPLQEVVGAAVGPALEVDQRPVHRDLGQAGQRAEGDLLDAGLGGRGQGDGVAVTAEPGVDPQHVDQGFFGLDGSSAVGIDAAFELPRGRGLDCASCQA